MKTFLLACILCLCATIGFSQGNTSTMSGVVTDASGAAVPSADVQVVNTATDQSFRTTTNELGEWVVPSLGANTYKVTVSKPGFKTATLSDVVLQAGVPANVPMKLEVGQATETVTVSGGADIVQATSAELSTTLTGTQVTSLPFATRNAIELMVTQAGTATPTTPRSSTINGLPKGALNVTIDGMNTQDNLLKSNDGFFSYIMPSVDSLEEVTLTTSAGGVDSTAQGAAQIKFVTKSGTNQFHGGGFYQTRNTFFDANYFFNNQQHLPRDVIKLRQMGGHVGGPILKDKLFFFTNYEIYRLPGTKSYSRTVLTPDAINGLYTYRDSAAVLHTVNLFSLAAAANASLPAGTRQFATTPDPLTAATYQAIAKLTNGGNLINNQASNDYISNSFNYQPTGTDSRDFFTARLDYNVTEKHHVSFSYDYDKYVSVPDFLNNVVAVYPGTGTVLGSDVNTGQRSNRFVGVLALRSTLTSRLTNELRGGLNGGTVLFFDAVNDGLFSPWRGYSPSLIDAAVATNAGPQRRNGPAKDAADTMTWVKGSHQVTFGGNFTQINLWQQIIGTSLIPRVAMNSIATGDPLITGSTAPFVVGGNFPGASSSQVTAAANLYASLTGRISSFTTSVVLDEKTHTYIHSAPIDRNRDREYGLFAQDTWRIRPNLTLSYGMRWEKEGAWENLNHTYTANDTASLWGLSGIGNLFKPGVLTGVAPTFVPVTDANTYHMPAVWAPSVGLAWQLPAKDGPLALLLGHHQGAAVLRVGYSLSTIREGSNVYQNIYGSNKGLNFDASISPTTFPADFGAPGSVWFRDASLPSRSGLPTTPSYPLTALFTDALDGFAPNLKMGYVQSWNIGFQREMGRNTVIEFRYTGNHGVHQWRQYNLDEVNIVENGFLTEFLAAQNNLRIARGGNLNNNVSVTNFGNQGLPGQVAIPFLTAALGTACCTDSTTATNLYLGQAGTLANAIATNATRNTNFTKAGYPANYFVVNPTVAGNGSYIVTNDGSSYFDAGQVEVRRRLSAGLQLQGNYQFGKSLANGATSSATDYAQPVTLRNLGLSKLPSSFDIRHSIKVNTIYELPFGPGRHFLGSVGNPVARKALEGWQIAGVVRLQSGTPMFWSSFATFNASGSGVIYHNITQSQIQNMMGIYKTQTNTGVPIVYYLPPPPATTVGLNSSNNTNFITNTQAAFQVNSLTPAQVDPDAPYIGPAPAGQNGCQCYFYLPWQQHYDVSVVKITRLKERANLEIRAQALDVFNITNFLPGTGNTSSGFGQITSAYRDISGTVDPGARILEFVARINF